MFFTLFKEGIRGTAKYEERKGSSKKKIIQKCTKERPVGPDGYTGLARTIKQNGGVISREGICVTLAEELIDKPCMLPLALADVPLEKDSF